MGFITKFPTPTISKFIFERREADLFIVPPVQDGFKKCSMAEAIVDLTRWKYLKYRYDNPDNVRVTEEIINIFNSIDCNIAYNYDITYRKQYHDIQYNFLY